MVKTSPRCSIHPRGCRWDICNDIRENISPMFDLGKEIEVHTVNSSQDDTVSGVIDQKGK